MRFLEAYRDLIEDKSFNVLAAIAPEKTNGYGRTRLLQQLTLRAVFDGHVPCPVLSNSTGWSIPKDPLDLAVLIVALSILPFLRASRRITWRHLVLTVVLAPVTVTLAPLAVNNPDELPLVPTTTLPRSMVVGVTASCPTATVPVPDKGMVRVGFEALDVMVSLPLALPADDGANETLKLVLCPAVSVTGVVVYLMLYHF